MPTEVAVVVEHAWHRVPGGTATAVDATLRALERSGGVLLGGIAAAHRSPGDSVIPATHSRLPRPLLYESWHRLGLPRSGRTADVIWAPALAVPPRSRPLVVTVHDVDFLDHPERLSRRGAAFFPRAWRAVQRRADAIAVPSNVVANDVERHGVDPERVHVIPWGVDVRPVADHAKAEVRRRFGLPATFVLWVGTAEPRKNVAGLVEAMTGIDAPLVVVGPEGWRVDLDSALAVLGDRVIRLGHVDRSDLEAVYALATVFAFPSFDEGFGLPVLEAMAQGTPVVTSKGTATEEAAGGAAALIDPHDPSSIRAGISELLDDGHRRQALGDAGRQRAAAASWDRTAASYLGLFQRLAERGGRS